MVKHLSHILKELEENERKRKVVEKQGVILIWNKEKKKLKKKWLKWISFEYKIRWKTRIIIIIDIQRDWREEEKISNNYDWTIELSTKKRGESKVVSSIVNWIIVKTKGESNPLVPVTGVISSSLFSNPFFILTLVWLILNPIKFGQSESFFL